MATLPQASLTINDSSGAFAGSTGYAVVMGCVAQNADSVPRVMSSVQDLISEYGYAPAVAYCALHIAATRKPVIFVGMPITTAGTVGSQNSVGVTGSSAITVVAAASGILEKTSIILTVVQGTTVGTDQIIFTLSCDGGVSTQTVRLGTANTYTIPSLGIVIDFGAGTLNAGDVYTAQTTAPMWGSTAISTARTALAAQQNLARSWIVVGNLTNSTFAGYVTTEANNYEDTNQRFTYARAQVPDMFPLAAKSQDGAETLTFAASGETCTRSVGGWLKDGFAAGQTIVIKGSVSNNSTYTVVTVTDTVLTVTAGFVNETVVSKLVSCVQTETVGAYVSAQTAAFATVDAQPRIDIALGRAFVQDPITGWSFRRPAAWAASIREYQHDLQIPCWRKSDGPLQNWSIYDANGNTVEFDERVDGGGLAGRFTVLRSYGNGPLGTYVALSLTRDNEGSLFSRTHNVAVANLACTVVQAATENAIGQVLVLNSDGTGSAASLAIIEQMVNRALEVNLLQNFQEGQRASSAVWTANKTAILNVPGATLNGNLALLLDGTLENINTTVTIQTAGA